MSLLQEIPSLLPGLGLVGYILTAIMIVVMWRQRNWRSAADASAAEMSVHKLASERLRLEIQTLHEKNDALLKQTDLQPLVKTIGDWVMEGRTRFDRADLDLKANTARVDANTLALTELVKEVKAQREAGTDAYRQLTASFISHTLDDKQQQLETRKTELRVATALDSIEHRLSIVAVQIGLHKWEAPDNTPDNAPLKVTQVGDGL